MATGLYAIGQNLVFDRLNHFVAFLSTCTPSTTQSHKNKHVQKYVVVTDRVRCYRQNGKRKYLEYCVWLVMYQYTISIFGWFRNYTISPLSGRIITRANHEVTRINVCVFNYAQVLL
jgi:hypothetical protein